MFQQIYLLNLSTSNYGKIKSSIQLNFKSSEIITLDIDNFEVSDVKKGSLLIIPGVGSFEKASQKLKENNNLNKLSFILNSNEYYKLCICLGFQILFTSSTEGDKDNTGLNIYKGSVKEFDTDICNFSVNTGYSGIIRENDFKDLDYMFYFNHKYCISPQDYEIYNNVDYYHSLNGKMAFLAMLKDPSKKLLGMQFHPEMSGKFVMRELLELLFCYDD